MRSTTLPAAPVSLRSMASFAIMLATAAVNLFVISYETRAVGRLGSEVLLADAMQTRGDVAGSRWQTMPVPASGSEAHRAIEVEADGQDRVTQGDRSRWGRQKGGKPATPKGRPIATSPSKRYVRPSGVNLNGPVSTS